MVIGFGDKMIDENSIRELKAYAEENNIPIMTESGIRYLMNYIKTKGVNKVLEIGTAIAYSAIMMSTVNKDLSITTIERDEKRYLEALKNIKRFGLEDRIHLIYNDALEVKLDDYYDLIFIDAAKAQNQNFFERFEKNLKENGTIITDNMKFHGLVDKDPSEIESKNLRQLVKKIKDYTLFLQGNEKYETEFLDIGDGIAVSKKVNNNNDRG